MLEEFFEMMDMTTRLNEYLCPKILRLFEIIALFRNNQPVDGDLKEIPKVENSDQNQDECLLESEFNFPPKISYILPKAKRIIHSEHYRPHEWDPNALCGLILVDNDFTARLLFYLLNVRINFFLKMYIISFLRTWNDLMMSMNFWESISHWRCPATMLMAQRLVWKFKKLGSYVLFCRTWVPETGVGVEEFPNAGM